MILFNRYISVVKSLLILFLLLLSASVVVKAQGEQVFLPIISASSDKGSEQDVRVSEANDEDCDTENGGQVLVYGFEWMGVNVCKNIYGNSFPPSELNTGPKFQCMELIQRFYQFIFGYSQTWQGIGSAKDIYTNPTNNNKMPDVVRLENTKSTVLPVWGDVLVFNAISGYPDGHVAIVQKVENGRVYFVQQNIGDVGSDSIPYSVDLYGKITITSDGSSYGDVLGWLHTARNYKRLEGFVYKGNTNIAVANATVKYSNGQIERVTQSNNTGWFYFDHTAGIPTGQGWLSAQSGDESGFEGFNSLPIARAYKDIQIYPLTCSSSTSLFQLSQASALSCLPTPSTTPTSAPPPTVISPPSSDGISVVSVSSHSVTAGAQFQPSVTLRVNSGSLLVSRGDHLHAVPEDSANTLGAYPVQALPGNVATGGTVTFSDPSMKMTAPNTPGTYRSKWQLRVGGNHIGPVIEIVVNVQSASSTPVPAGWTVEWYSDRGLNGRCGNTETIGDFQFYLNWPDNGPSGCPKDDWGAKFFRDINFSGGDYLFHCHSDDGCIVKVDGQKVIDCWWDKSFSSCEGGKNLSGTKRVEIQYYDNTGEGRLSFWLMGTGFLPIRDNCDPNQWCGSYYPSNEQLIPEGDPAIRKNEGTGTLRREFGYGSPGYGINADHFSAKWERTVWFAAGQYRFFMEHDDGGQVYVDGKTVLDHFNYCCDRDSSDIWLTEGNHNIKVTYREAVSEAYMRVWWETLQQCYALTTNIVPANSGNVSKTSGNCTTDSSKYLPNTTVTISAAPAAYYVIQGISGDDIYTTGTQASVVMNWNKAVTAYFVLAPLTAPSNLQTDQIQYLHSSAINFSWAEVIGAQTYTLMLLQNGTVYSQTTGASTTHTFRDLPTGNYEWKVQAKNGNGDGPWALEHFFTVLAPPTSTATPTPTNTSSPTNTPVPLNTVSVPNVTVNSGTSGTFAIHLDNLESISSGQIRFTHADGLGLQITGAEVTARTNGFTTSAQYRAPESPGWSEYEILFYNQAALKIAPNSGAILTVHYTTAITASGSTPLSVTLVILTEQLDNLTVATHSVNNVHGLLTIQQSTPTGTPTPTATNTVVPTPTGTATPTEVPTIQIPLAAGWNLISLPGLAGDTPVTEALESITGKYSLVYGYERCQGDSWLTFNVTAPPYANNLHVVNSRMGLWVKMELSATLTTSAALGTPVSIPLCSGWNLIGYPTQHSQAPAQALSPISGCYDSVYVFTPPDTWERFNTTAPPYANDLASMQPGKGYWIHSTQNCTWSVSP